MCRRGLALLALLALAGAVLPATRAAPAAFRGKRVLALIGADGVRQSHSKFFAGLKDAGLELDVRSHKDADLALRNYDAWNYDHLLLFAPKASSESAAEARRLLRLRTEPARHSEQCMGQAPQRQAVARSRAAAAAHAALQRRRRRLQLYRRLQPPADNYP